jgi:hypothetical protein
MFPKNLIILNLNDWLTRTPQKKTKSAMGLASGRFQDAIKQIEVPLSFSRTIRLQGKQYPLYLNIAVNPNEERPGSLTITSTVPIPAGYPKTPLTAKIHHFASLTLIVGYSPVYQPEKEEKEHVSHLEFFDTVSFDMREFELPEEAIVLRGLGRLSLCKTIETLLKINPNLFGRDLTKSWLTLTAQSDVASEQEEKELAELQELSEKQLLKKLIRTNPEAVANWIRRGVSSEDIPLFQFVFLIQHNNKLLDYYKRVYGFQLTHPVITYEADMIVSVDRLLQHCRL